MQAIDRITDKLRPFVDGERGKLEARPGRHDGRLMAQALANVAVSQGGGGDILVPDQRE